MATVGGVATDILRGVPEPALKESVESWHVPGMDGHGAQLLGGADTSFMLLGIEFGTSAVVNTWAAAIRTLQGTIISVTDDWGDTFTNLLVEHVSQLRKVAAVNGASTARGELRIRVRKVN